MRSIISLTVMARSTSRIQVVSRRAWTEPRSRLAEVTRKPITPPVFSFLESTKSVVERYQKIRLGVPDGRRVIALPLQCFADRPQYSFPNVPCQSLRFPKGSFPFGLTSLT